MAVTRYVGDKFVGLSSDSKPTTVSDGATFYETDTKRMYCLISGTWTEMTGDLDDHESTYDHPSYDTHVAASAPHSGHEETANKGAASGYASLNSSTLVPTAELGTGTASSSTFLRGDQTWASPGASSDEQQDVVGGRIKRDSDTQISWEFVTSNHITLYNETSSAWELVKIATAPTLATTSFTASMMHDIYVVYSSGTAVTLEARAWSGLTTPPTRATLDGRTVYGTGTGEKEKRLVARVYVDASKYVRDEKSKRYLVNVYNPRLVEIGVDNPYSTSQSFSLQSVLTRWEGDTTWKVEFVSDGENAVALEIGGVGRTSSVLSIGVIYDAETDSDPDAMVNQVTASNQSQGFVADTRVHTEGFHYAYPAAGRDSSSGSMYVWYVDTGFEYIVARVTGQIRC